MPVALLDAEILAILGHTFLRSCAQYSHEWVPVARVITSCGTFEPAHPAIHVLGALVDGGL